MPKRVNAEEKAARLITGPRFSLKNRGLPTQGQRSTEPTGGCAAAMRELRGDVYLYMTLENSWMISMTASLGMGMPLFSHSRTQLNTPAL